MCSDFSCSNLLAQENLPFCWREHSHQLGPSRRDKAPHFQNLFNDLSLIPSQFPPRNPDKYREWKIGPQGAVIPSLGGHHLAIYEKNKMAIETKDDMEATRAMFGDSKNWVTCPVVVTDNQSKEIARWYLKCPLAPGEAILVKASVAPRSKASGKADDGKYHPISCHNERMKSSDGEYYVAFPVLRSTSQSWVQKSYHHSLNKHRNGIHAVPTCGNAFRWCNITESVFGLPGEATDTDIEEGKGCGGCLMYSDYFHPICTWLKKFCNRGFDTKSQMQNEEYSPQAEKIISDIAKNAACVDDVCKGVDQDVANEVRRRVAKYLGQEATTTAVVPKKKAFNIFGGDAEEEEEEAPEETKAADAPSRQVSNKELVAAMATRTPTKNVHASDNERTEYVNLLVHCCAIGDCLGRQGKFVNYKKTSTCWHVHNPEKDMKPVEADANKAAELCKRGKMLGRDGETEFDRDKFISQLVFGKKKLKIGEFLQTKSKAAETKPEPVFEDPDPDFNLGCESNISREVTVFKDHRVPYGIKPFTRTDVISVDSHGYVRSNLSGEAQAFFKVDGFAGVIYRRDEGVVCCTCRPENRPDGSKVVEGFHEAGQSVLEALDANTLRGELVPTWAEAFASNLDRKRNFAGTRRAINDGTAIFVIFQVDGQPVSQEQYETVTRLCEPRVKCLRPMPFQTPTQLKGIYDLALSRNQEGLVVYRHGAAYKVKALLAITVEVVKVNNAASVVVEVCESVDDLRRGKQFSINCCGNKPSVGEFWVVHASDITSGGAVQGGVLQYRTKPEQKRRLLYLSEETDVVDLTCDEDTPPRPKRQRVIVEPKQQQQPVQPKPRVWLCSRR